MQFNVDALADNDNFVAAGQRLAEVHLVMACQDGWQRRAGRRGDGARGSIELSLGSLALLLDDPACRRRS